MGEFTIILLLVRLSTLSAFGWMYLVSSLQVSVGALGFVTNCWGISVAAAQTAEAASFLRKP